QMYVLDFGGSLADLAALPHVGAVVGAGDRERQERLIRLLRTELERRRTEEIWGPTVVLLVDGFGAFHAAFDDVHGLPWREELTRVFADGPAYGLFAAVVADRPGSVPPSVAACFAERLVFRLSDPLDAALFG